MDQLQQPDHDSEDKGALATKRDPASTLSANLQTTSTAFQPARSASTKLQVQHPWRPSSVQTDETTLDETGLEADTDDAAVTSWEAVRTADLPPHSTGDATAKDPTPAETRTGDAVPDMASAASSDSQAGEPHLSERMAAWPSVVETARRDEPAPREAVDVPAALQVVRGVADRLLLAEQRAADLQAGLDALTERARRELGTADEQLQAATARAEAAETQLAELVEMIQRELAPTLVEAVHDTEQLAAHAA